MKTCVLKFSHSHHLSCHSEGLGAFITTENIESTNNLANNPQHKFFNGNALGDPVSDFHVSTPLKDIEWSIQLTTWERKM